MNTGGFHEGTPLTEGGPRLYGGFGVRPLDISAADALATPELQNKFAHLIQNVAKTQAPKERDYDTALDVNDDSGAGPQVLDDCPEGYVECDNEQLGKIGQVCNLDEILASRGRLYIKKKGNVVCTPKDLLERQLAGTPLDGVTTFEDYIRMLQLAKHRLMVMDADNEAFIEKVRKAQNIRVAMNKTMHKTVNVVSSQEGVLRV